jgi:hypothetical protein
MNDNQGIILINLLGQAKLALRDGRYESAKDLIVAIEKYVFEQWKLKKGEI